jgi:hypothetical protein
LRLREWGDDNGMSSIWGVVSVSSRTTRAIIRSRPICPDGSEATGKVRAL